MFSWQTAQQCNPGEDMDSCGRCGEQRFLVFCAAFVTMCHGFAFLFFAFDCTGRGQVNQNPLRFPMGVPKGQEAIRNCMPSHIDHLLSSSPLFRRSAIAFLILALALIDILNGYEYSFSVFYLLPVAIAAWYDARALAAAAILVSALAWFVADSFAGHPYSNQLIPVWNAFVRLVFFSVVAVLLGQLRKYIAQLQSMAMLDPLTQIHNSRALRLQYQIMRSLAERHGESLSVALIDLDGFKQVNDRYGHSAGDEVIIRFARLLSSMTRRSDLVARLGGDEFAAVLSNSDAKGAEAFHTRLRLGFTQSGLREQYGIDFSMGIHSFTVAPAELDEATAAADTLMYQAKKTGKSRTSFDAS